MGCFRCLECSTLVRNVEQQFKYTEPLMCPSAGCHNKCALPPRGRLMPTRPASCQLLPAACQPQQLLLRAVRPGTIVMTPD